jgi:hypothetical protein
VVKPIAATPANAINVNSRINSPRKSQKQSLLQLQLTVAYGIPRTAEQPPNLTPQDTGKDCRMRNAFHQLARPNVVTCHLKSVQNVGLCDRLCPGVDQIPQAVFDFGSGAFVKDTRNGFLRQPQICLVFAWYSPQEIPSSRAEVLQQKLARASASHARVIAADPGN